MTKNRQLTIRVFYGLLAAILTYTLIAQCILTHSQGRSLLNTFSYFTIQSNMLVILTSGILAFKPNITGNWWRILRLAALAGITVTGIVFVTVLAKYVELSGAALVYNYLFHYVSPTATVLGFIFVGPRLGLKWRDMWFMAWPVAWVIYTMTRGAVFHPVFNGFTEYASQYPYGFLDVNRVPLSEVIGSIIIIALLITAVGSAYIWGDRRLDRMHS